MALQLVIERTELTTDYTVVTLTNTTGAYNADTNPGGFGAPNAVRSATWIHYFAYQLGLDGTKTILEPIAGYVGTSSETVSFTIEPDGVLQFYAIPFTTTIPSGTFPALTTLWYDVATSRIMQVVTANTTADAVELTTLDEVITAGSAVGDVELYDIITCSNRVKVARMYHYYQSSHCWDKKKAWADYLTFFHQIAGAEYNFGFGNYSEAAEILDALNEDDCETLKRCGC